jgi:signal transduction histidine kinase/CheY-like chemotaxis protein
MTGIGSLRGKFGGSLQAQAVAANFLPVAAASSCILVLFGTLYFAQLAAFHNELQLRGQSLAESLSRQCELAALLGDRAELERLAGTVVAVEGVLYVVMDGASGERLVTVTRGRFPSTDIPARAKGIVAGFDDRGTSGRHRFVDVAADIRQADPQRLVDWEDSAPASAPLGRVRVGLSTESHHAMYQRSFWIVIALSFVSLFVTLGVQYRQMRRILSPLKTLMAFTRRVAEGDLTQRAPVVRHDEVGQLAVSCNEMVCDLERSRSELLQALDAAHEASRMKSQFLANMSHEIRTPLNGVIGMTEMALDGELSAEPREQLNTALTSARALLSILNDILDLSKIEAGKLDLDCIPFDLETEVESAAKSLAGQAHRKGIELVCDIGADAPRMVLGDPDRLRQVLTNLISNAIKFTSEGEVLVGVSIDREAAGNLTLQFTVSDTGIGIPLSKQQAIFEAFTQADGSMTRRYGGTGLGLTICARLIEMMGGTIRVESEIGTGSSFIFTANFARTNDPAPRGEAVEPAVLAGVRTLIVDDNETNRRILAGVLRIWDMDAVSSDSGAAAMTALLSAEKAGHPFRLVILDAMMPEMDGFEVARRIKQTVPGEPPIVMMLSSCSMNGDSTNCRNLGITRYLTKPVSRGELREVMLRALGHERKQDSAQIDKRMETLAEPRVLSILVAEDNLVNQKVLYALLQKAGHRVELTRDGLEALAAHSDRAFDLIMMDIQMPNMDGWEATRLIREKESSTGEHVPIIALTAHALKGDRELCMDAGMDGYVTKPVSRTLLFQAIDEVVGARQG